METELSRTHLKLNAVAKGSNFVANVSRDEELNGIQ